MPASQQVYADKTLRLLICDYRIRFDALRKQDGILLERASGLIEIAINRRASPTETLKIRAWALFNLDVSQCALKRRV